jgi:poly(3-hydroxybutyrate) depolymerase
MNKQIFAMAVAMFLVNGGVVHADTLPASHQTAMTMKQPVTMTVGCSYLLYLPQGYAKTQKLCPLVVFLHGSGERGSDIEKIKAHGLPKMIEQGNEYPFIIASPQCPADDRWNSKSGMAMLKGLIAKLEGGLRVDRSRIYLTGLSMGGFGTWALAQEMPHTFAAIAPASAGFDTARITPDTGTSAWIFHGMVDNVVRFGEGERSARKMREAGADVQFTVFPALGHVCWDSVYANPDLYTWFLRHRLPAKGVADPVTKSNSALLKNVSITMDTLAATQVKPACISGLLHAVNQNSRPAVMTISFISNDSVSPAVCTLAVAAHAKVDTPISLRSDPREGIPPLACMWTAAFDSVTILKGFERLAAGKPVAYKLSRGTISVDGNIQDWGELPYRVNAAGQKTVARFNLRYDSSSLYIGVAVIDEYLSVDTAKNVWEQDGLIIRIDARSGDKRDNRVNDWEDVLPLFISPVGPARSPLVWKGWQLPNGSSLAWGKTGDGYAVEIAVPVAYVQAKQGGPWKDVAFNIAIDNSNKDGTHVETCWHPDWLKESMRSGTGVFLRE